MSTRNEPAEAEVYVWRATSPETDDPRLAAWRRALDPSERRREHELRNDLARRDFVTARGLLKHRLADALDCSVDAVSLESGPYGRPRLAGGAARLDPDGRLDFNVSHSEGHVLVAIARGVRVGVDVQVPREGTDALAIAQRYFAPVEAESIAALEGEKRTRAFYRMWTGKEAYAKAVGAGLQISLASFEVAAPENESVSLVRAHEGDVDAWRLLELDGGPSTYAALAVSPAAARVRVFR